MVHAAELSLHGDAAGVAVADAEVEPSASAALNPQPRTQSDVPPVSSSVATQSAVYEEPGEDGRPVYRGFQDPQSQSQTFKNLQSIIAAGEGKKTQPVGPVWRDKYIS